MSNTEVKRTVIHWFRKGQRIHDNPALHKACELIKTNSDFVLRPIFILDPKILEWMTVGANRFRFLQESLTQLNENLATINSRLYVIRGNPTEVFSRILKEWNVAVLSFETDIEPYALKRDEEITKMAEKQGTIIISESSHTIYNPERVLLKNLGKVPMQYQKFMSIVQQLPVSEPYQKPDVLPKRSIPSKDSCETENPNCYDPPLLEEVIRNPKDLGPNKYPGGETQALLRMEKYLKQTNWICAFEKPNTSPNSIEPSTTVLSPYFKFGCLSSRLFYKKLKEILATHPKHSKPPVSLIGQMMWREFYYTAAAGEPNFDRMVGNSICLQIPWQKNDDHLKAWTYGQTGYPFIDAIMRQLRQEGWIHHLARHAVACFLTRGDLWISWEEGQKVFEELLLDADWALNAGNWMWLSASAFFYKYFRVYSPVAFGKKTDPEGLYIRKYVPELTKYPAGIIFEPWKASLAAQKEYGCVIGKDYPHRIVIHEEIHKHNLLKMKEAYKRNRELKSGTIENSESVPSSSQKRKMESPPAAIGRNAKKVSKGTTPITKFFKKK